MNQLQERKRSMFHVLEDYLATVPEATIAQMPNFSALTLNFTSKVSEIDRYAEDQTWDRDGFVMDKNDYKREMALRAANVAYSVKAYANNTGDMALRKAMSMTASYLANLSENTSVDKCRFIYTKAKELLGSLDVYGVKLETIEFLNESIKNYVDSIPLPRTNIVRRKQATDQLALLFAECEKNLKDMDLLAEMLRYREPLFYATYFSSRKVIQPSYKTLSIFGKVTDSEGMPITKVRVSLKGTLISKFTSNNGGFEIKHLESKVYTLQLVKSGYLSTVLEVPVTATERTELSVVLERDISSDTKTA